MTTGATDVCSQGRADITSRRGSGAHSVLSDPEWTASPKCSGLICGSHDPCTEVRCEHAHHCRQHEHHQRVEVPQPVFNLKTQGPLLRSAETRDQSSIVDVVPSQKHKLFRHRSALQAARPCSPLCRRGLSMRRDWQDQLRSSY